MTVMSPKLPARAHRPAPRSPQPDAGNPRKIRVYFHCSHASEVFVDAVGIDVEDLVEAYACAGQVVRAYVERPTLDDWRGWTLHVSDADGQELFVMPFVAALGWAQ